MVFSGGLAISKLRAAAGQSSAARLLWRAGCAVVFFGSPKNEGEQSADRRWCGTPHPVARLAVEPISGSPEITGGIRPPARLSALCCGVFLAASGRAFCGAFGAAVSQLLAGGHSTSGRSPDAAREHGCEPCARAPLQSAARNCRAPAAGRRDRISSPAYPACSTLKTPHECAPRRAG